MNLTELLDASAARWPQKAALIEGERVVSYTQLRARASDLATHLSAAVSQPGRRVGLCYPNSVNYVGLTFALWRLRAVVVPIPMECTPEEVFALAESMGLEAIVSHHALSGSSAVAPEVFVTRLSPATPPYNHGLNLAFIRFTS